MAIWDLEADEAEVWNHKEEDVLCAVAMIIGGMNALTARGRPIHRATCRGMGSSHRWTWWSWQGTTYLTIPGATALVSSQPTGAYAPNMGPGGGRGGLLKGPTEDHREGNG